MNKLIAVVLVGFAVNTFGASEVVVPIAKVDALAVNDAAKMNDAKRKAEGVGMVGRVWGYVKDGVVYMASSTADATTSHPYLTAAGIAAAVFVDKNNNYTGLWKKGEGGNVTGNTATTSTADNSVRQDNSVRTEINDNSGNITIIVQSPMQDALK